MKPRKLYLRIFFSFLAILFVTELLIFILFLAIPAKRFGSRLEQFTQQKVLIFKNLIEEKINSTPLRPISADHRELEKFIVSIGQIIGAKVWIAYPDGNLMVQSFGGTIPETTEIIKKSKVQHQSGSYQLYHRRHMDFYAVIPVAFSADQMGTMHIFFEGREAAEHEWYFGLGLAVIGVVIALLVIPVARPITRRIRQLRLSILRIADGDLSHRVTICGADEISELANSFNQMTDKLESLIHNTKELTANISHELRTPLARIRIAEELLADKLEKAQIHDGFRHLEDIRTDVDELDRLVNRILELSKLDLRESSFTPTPMDLAAMLTEVIRTYQPMITRRHLRLVVEVATGLTVMADSTTLRTALANLLDNAVKFTPEKGEIYFEAKPQTQGVSLTVVNTHEPLSEMELSKIFNPFYRAGRTKTHGSGLGLAIAAKIIRKHRGTLEACNTDRGLAFKLWFPQNKAPI